MAPRDDDGLPPVERGCALSPDQEAVRRVLAEHFDGVMQRLADAIGKSRASVRAYITGVTQVDHGVLVAIAEHLDTTVEHLRAPHPQAIWAGRWITPSDPEFEQVRRVLIAMLPDLDT